MSKQLVEQLSELAQAKDTQKPANGIWQGTSKDVKR